MFTEQDYNDISQQGISISDINNQMSVITCDKSKVELSAPIVANNGLYVIEEDKINSMLGNYKKKVGEKKLVKFVPASGAATRMFKDIVTFINENVESESVKVVVENLSSFAFYPKLKEKMQQDGLQIETLIQEKDYTTIFKYLLFEKGLNYLHLPKGLLHFHKYNQEIRTPIEEHLIESVAYTTNKNNVARVHFTISPEHSDLFCQNVANFVNQYEVLFNVKFDVTYSFQHSSTNTLTFDCNNELFRDKNNRLVFRPGGHGSLIKNLNEIDADVIFIKNIDNVTTDDLRADTIKYKKILASLLLDFQQDIFSVLQQFDNQTKIAENIQKAENILQKCFFVKLSDYYKQLSEEKKVQYLYRLLNRPIRVCGVVKQEGEPGGGPFWVCNTENNEKNLQIVETSEINLDNQLQKNILESSQFFNPVDLVCATKNHKGEFFDLYQYVDYQRFFVTNKTFEGKNIKAIENPGLWNGAMSNWLTVFVSVPLSTFSPVKTINDLLRKEHCKK